MKDYYQETIENENYGYVEDEESYIYQEQQSLQECMDSFTQEDINKMIGNV